MAKAKTEGKVVFYSAAGDEKTMKAISDAFKAKYGVAIEGFQAPIAQLMERYYADAQRGEPPDVLAVSDTGTAEQLIKDDVYARHPAAGAQADYPPELLRHAPFAYPYGLIPFGVAFNTNAVGAAGASQFPDWDAVFDAKWAGKFGMPDPNAVGGALNTTWILRQTLGEAKWTALEQKLAALKPKVFTSNFPLANAVASGEVAIAYAYDAAFSGAITSGAPVQVAYPPPTPAYFGLAGVVKASKRPNAARLFMDWYTSVEGQETWSTTYGDTPANPKAKPKRVISMQSWFVAPKQIVFPKETPPQDQLKAHLAEFNRVVLGR